MNPWNKKCPRKKHLKPQEDEGFVVFVLGGVEGVRGGSVTSYLAITT